MNVEETIGKTKLSEAMPLLKTIAEENNLRLCVAKDFLAAKDILIKKIKTISQLSGKK
jgi:hypothetical protein